MRIPKKKHIPDFVHVLLFSSKKFFKLPLLSHGEAKTPPNVSNIIKIEPFLIDLIDFESFFKSLGIFPLMIEIL